MKSLLLSLAIVLVINSYGFGQDKPVAEKQDSIEATSLLGVSLKRMEFSKERLAKLTADLETAKKKFELDPKNAENIIWYGRRLAYLWRYNDAVKVFSDGIKLHPREPKLYRHRGHRYITLRQFDLAIADLTKAAQFIAEQPDVVEPDGQPNAAGIPTSTLHTNIWYHLGLAHYLKGDFPAALAAYEKCLAASKNNDMRVATLDWMYMTLRRLKREQDAKKLIENVTADLKIIENHAYHNRILMYRGKKKPEDLIPSKSEKDRDLDIATYGYGVGNWYLVNGHKAKAKDIFDKVVAGKYWSAFGFIASENELATIFSRK